MLQPEIIVALLSMLGTLAGSVIGVLTANKLTTFRLEQLEKKVEKHNNLVERKQGCYHRGLGCITPLCYMAWNARSGQLGFYRLSGVAVHLQKPDHHLRGVELIQELRLYRHDPAGRRGLLCAGLRRQKRVTGENRRINTVGLY
mgnify:CR=1 FL=1